MIHNVFSGSWGDAYAMKSDSDEALRLNKRFTGLLAENCGINYPKLQTLIKDAVGSKEIWLSAEDAKKFGVVDHVGVPRIEARVEWSFQIPPSKPKIKRAESTKRSKTKTK
jgi:ATP-dependent protease ClpP protease subunit